MKANMGSLDKVLRIFIAIVFAILFINKTVEGTSGIILLVVGGIFLFTSIVNFCPLYHILGINTRSKK